MSTYQTNQVTSFGVKDCLVSSSSQHSFQIWVANSIHYKEMVLAPSTYASGISWSPSVEPAEQFRYKERVASMAGIEPSCVAGGRELSELLSWKMFILRQGRQYFPLMVISKQRRMFTRKVNTIVGWFTLDFRNTSSKEGNFIGMSIPLLKSKYTKFTFTTKLYPKNPHKKTHQN